MQSKNAEENARRPINAIRKPAFNIVYIAYSEVSAMSGSDEQSSPPGRDGSGEGVDRTVKEYECVGRIARIPIVESTASAVSSLYSSVKQSHCAVETVFENVEEGWNKGAEIVGPFTSKIEEKLERPLRAIDGAACVGLDFVEDKIPSVKLPPEEMYEKSKNYVARNVFAPAAHFTSTIIENFRDKLSRRCAADNSAKSEFEKSTTNHPGDNDVAENHK